MKILDWDSRFFGCRIGRLQRPDPDRLDEARARGVACLYLLVDASDLSSVERAESLGFGLKDIRVTLEWRADKAASLPEPVAAVRRARDQDVTFLEEIASRSHRDTRFYADRRFDPQRVDEMYRVWIRKSCSNNESTVWVWDEGSGAAGYATCEAGSIGLVAIHEGHRGKGAGQALTVAALRWLEQSGSQTVSVVTQGRNIEAQRLYQRCGFLPRSVEFWYHLWL